MTQTWTSARVAHSHRFQRAGRLGMYLTLTSLSASCSLLLDFGDLEDCKQCDGGGTTEAVVAPSSPPADCASTTEAAGQNGTSTLLQRRRLADLSADTIHKTQVLVGQRFLYHLAYVVQDDHPDVILRAFALDALEASDTREPLAAQRTVRVSDFLEPPHVVRSAGSITLDGALRVVLYVAQGSPDIETAALSRLVFAPDLSESSALKGLTDPPNYRVNADVRVGPAAGVLGNGEPFVTWQGCKSQTIAETNDLCAAVDGTPGRSAIYTQSGERRLDREYLSTHGLEEMVPVGALEPLSGGEKPAVVWGTTSSDTVVSLWMGVPHDNVKESVLQCHALLGFALHSLHATPTSNGISSVLWSKRLANGTSSVTEASSIGCDEQCTEQLPEGTTELCDDTLFSRRVFDNVRYAAHGVHMLEQNTEAIIVSAQVDDLEEGQTRLTVTRTHGSPNPNLSPFLDPRSDAPPLAVGTPAWPHLHVQPKPVQQPHYAVVGLSWEESDANKTVAKLQTYGLCLP